MKYISKYRFAYAALFAIAAGIFMTMNNERVVNATTTADRAENPLLAEWVGPYGGVPAFDKIKVSDFAPALEAAMAENLKEIDAIANNSEAPTFENTMIPLEKSGAALSRASRIFEIYSNSLNSKEFAPVEAAMQPKLVKCVDMRRDTDGEGNPLGLHLRS